MNQMSAIVMGYANQAYQRRRSTAVILSDARYIDISVSK